MHALNAFFNLLRKAPAGPVFNPWFASDVAHDIDSTAPEIRRSQLRAYLAERDKATLILLAEALGYQGGHFSGIPMTSERLLLGHLTAKGLDPDLVFSGSATRTSRPALKPDGFTEPTATIVWGALKDFGQNTRQVILWNAFPWHPYKPDKGMLSNRTPTDEEMSLGQPVLDALRRYVPQAAILAVGQKSASLLQSMGITAPALRHPANGGAGLFRAQLGKIVSQTAKDR